MYANLGPGHVAELDPPSPDGVDLLYSHEYVAHRMRQHNLYGYVESNPIGNVDPSGLYTIAARVFQLTLREKFDKWYRLEKADREWYKGLPKCPCCITLTGGEAKSPDSKVWLDPKPKKDFPAGPWALLEFTSEGALFPAPDLHPGAVWDMRQKTPTGKYGNQCMYDNEGKLLTAGMGAGTVDKRYYGKVDYHTWDILRLVQGLDKATQGWKHWQHDVIPFWAAWLLDNESYGANVAKYLEVRPVWVDEKCPKNEVPRPKPK